MFPALARTSAAAAAARFSKSAVRQTGVAVRSFASEADHQPPISLYGTAARYANATYVASSKAGNLDQVEGELNGLAKAASESSVFANFLDNPLISRDEKAAQMEALLTEKSVSLITTNLCSTMAGNARLNELPKVADAFGKLMKAKRGEVDATIISADPLTKKETAQVAEAIKASSQGASEVIISSKVDPSIIGGIQIQLGDKFLDLSIKSRISEVSKSVGI